MITIQEIADIVGVSRGTVDRVINHRGKVKAEVEEKILKIINEKGYQQKQRKKNITIGVITQLNKSSFMGEIQKGLDRAIEEYEPQGVHIHILHSDTVDEKEQLSLIDKLEESGIDALAIMPVDHDNITKRINELIDKGIPTVTFNSDISGTKRVCFVGMDNRKSGKVAANLLAMLTHKHGEILVITGYFTNRANSMRVESFVNEIQKYPDMKLLGVQCSYDEEHAVKEIVKSSLQTNNRIAGIYLVSAGQEGIYNAFSDLNYLNYRPFVIAHDVTENNIKRLKRGDFNFLIDQESHLQGYIAIQILFNILRKKKNPDKEEYYTNIQLKTKESI